MLQITYISSATEPMAREDLVRLLEGCRENNAGRGVTGMLLYGNGTFLQVLEGEDKVVDALLEQIRRDPRHTDLQVIERKSIARREYSDWSMGFQRVSDDVLRNIEGLKDFSARDFNSENLSQQHAIVQSLMNHFRKERFRTIGQSELGVDEEDAMINILHRIIRGSVRVMAVLMVVTIVWGVFDVGYMIYSQLLNPLVTEFKVQHIILVFGAFLAVLIAIEIFLNITLYLRDDVVHVKLVVATALMAIARKVIVMDFKEIEPMYVLSTAAVVLALGIVYWLMDNKMTWGPGESARRRRSAM